MDVQDPIFCGGRGASHLYDGWSECIANIWRCRRSYIGGQGLLKFESRQRLRGNEEARLQT